MEKFKSFIGKQINFEKLKNLDNLGKYCLQCQRIPENLDEFEEMEFLINDFVMCVAVLEGKIKRIMFVKVNKEDPDACSPLTKEELNNLLNKHGDTLVKFFENITT